MNDIKTNQYVKQPSGEENVPR